MSSRSLRPSRRKITASALAATLGLAGLGMTATPAGAVEETAVDRLSGPTRYGTAVDISEETFGTSDDVVLARGDLYPDALAGNGVAGALDAPILLTESDELTDVTAAEIEDLGAQTVYIMGGVDAISQNVEDALQAAGYTVVRIEGETRIGTSVDAANTIAELGTIGEVDGQTTAILVDAFGFPDAVSASPAAFALDLPVLLTHGDDLSDQVATAITDLGIERIVIVGGTAAVSQGVQDEVETMVDTVSRYSGPTRYETAVDFADEFLMAELGWDGPEYDLATGQKFPDALTGGPHAGTIQAPILLTPTADLAAATEAFLETNCQVFDVQIVLGGTAAVAETTAAAAAAAAQCEVTTNQAFAVTPGDTVVVDEGDAVDFTVAGIDAAEVEIALVECDNVTNTDGIITFAEDETVTTQTVADFGDVAADITDVNGTVITTPSDQVTATVTDGEITFTVDGVDNVQECYVAVVFADADEDGLLDIDADGLPTEDFGIGGLVNFITITALDASPNEAVNPFGQDHTVTAQLLGDDGSDANTLPDPAPYAGENIVFQVVRDGTVVSIGTADTDATGAATFTYTVQDPSATADNTITDSIVVFFDVDGDGVLDGTELDETVTKVWTDADAEAAALVVSPETDFNPVSTVHTVTATVVDQFGDPIADANIEFTLARDLEDSGSTDPANATFERVTNADGVATLSYTGPAESATDAVIVTVVDAAGNPVDLDNDTNATNDSETSIKFWVEEGVVAVDDAEVLAAVVAGDVVFVEDEGVALYEYLYSQGELFFVDGQAVTFAQFEQALAAADGDELLDVVGYGDADVATTFSLDTDTTAATVQSTTPEEGDVVGPDAVLVAVFDEDLSDASTVDMSCTTATDVVDGGTVSGDTLTLDPTDFAVDDTCTVTFNAVDLGGNTTVVGPINFTVDATDPTVAATDPAAGDTTVIFTANEELDAATVELIDFTETATADIFSVELGADGVTITVTLDGALLTSETVTLLADSVADLYGNLGPASDVVATA